MNPNHEHLREVVIELIDALKAQSAAEMASDHHDQYLERAIGEGWDSDPTGSSWLSGNSSIVRSMERRAKDQRKRVLSSRNIRSIMSELDELAALRKENEVCRAACKAMIEWDEAEQTHAVDFHARMDLCKAAFDAARAAIGDRHE